MSTDTYNPFPPVATWRINAMRFLFLLMAVIMGSAVWQQLLFESAEWDVMRGLAKSMLAALALMSLLGVRYPMQMLPLMIYEIAWLFVDCVGIVIAYFIVPWRYVWARYIVQPMEPLRQA
jgi:branched-subunit amino acid permease